MKHLFGIIAVLSGMMATAQPNCNVFLYEGDTVKYNACQVLDERAGHYQFSREYQEACDRSLAIDSTFGYPYKIKSTAYLKSGDMITWMELMNKAVELNPKEYLSYRGWCRYQFFRDYEGAIADIEELDRLVDYDIGGSVNGDYHLEIARALCYKALDEKEKAASIIEEHISSEDYYQGLFDYLHLGVLYFDLGEYDKAQAAFTAQNDHNPLAETDFYRALCYEAQGNLDQAQEWMNSAYDKYQSQTRMLESYTHHEDKIYLADIERELERIQGQN